MLKTKLQKFDKVFYFLRFLYLPNIARKGELEIPSLVKKYESTLYDITCNFE